MCPPPLPAHLDILPIDCYQQVTGMEASCLGQGVGFHLGREDEQVQENIEDLLVNFMFCFLRSISRFKKIFAQYVYMAEKSLHHIFW